MKTWNATTALLLGLHFVGCGGGAANDGGDRHRKVKTEEVEENGELEDIKPGALAKPATFLKFCRASTPVSVKQTVDALKKVLNEEDCLKLEKRLSNTTSIYLDGQGI